MIVPVKRVNLVLTPADKAGVFLALQKQELFMVKGFNLKNHPLYNNDQLVKTKKAISILEAHQKKKPFFSTISVDSVVLETGDEQAKTIVDKVIDLENKIGEKSEDIRRLTADNKAYLPFTFLSVAQEKLETSILVEFFSYKIKEEKREYIENALTKVGVEYEAGVYDKMLYIAIALFEDVKKDVEIALNAVEAEEIKLPKTHLNYNEAINKNEQKIQIFSGEIELLNGLIDEQTTNLELIKTYYDKEANILVREHIPHKTSENFILLEGYAREDQMPELEQVISTVTDDYEIEVIENAKEVLPTALKNNRFVKPFETITDSFSVPNNKEIDPNPAMSAWYWLFFGFMFADIGYGLILLAGTLLMLKLKKPRGGFKKLLQVFMYSSISTIVFGLITGSLFSVELTTIFPGLPNIFLSPVNDPMLVLIISLVVGAFHIMTALVFKTLRLIREKDILGALAEAVSWILILLLGLVFIADMMEILWPTNVIVSYGSLGLVLLGLAFIVFLSGRGNKNPLTWAMKGLGGLYGATSYLSDILSYSRLLALMLSGAVIGSTMNQLAGMVSGAFFGVGIIFSILIIIVGHLFNFAMSLLSAYVHGGRLQYLEFYGKFYEGGGIAFEPLAYQLNYINEIKEN